MSFIEKITEWALDKEEQLAKNCAISVCDIDEQIAKVKEKKQELQKKYEEEIKELEHLIEKLHFIRAEALKCEDKKQ